MPILARTLTVAALLTIIEPGPRRRGEIDAVVNPHSQDSLITI